MNKFGKSHWSESIFTARTTGPLLKSMTAWLGHRAIGFWCRLWVQDTPRRATSISGWLSIWYKTHVIFSSKKKIVLTMHLNLPSQCFNNHLKIKSKCRHVQYMYTQVRERKIYLLVVNFEIHVFPTNLKLQTKIS